MTHGRLPTIAVLVGLGGFTDQFEPLHTRAWTSVFRTVSDLVEHCNEYAPDAILVDILSLSNLDDLTDRLHEIPQSCILGRIVDWPGIQTGRAFGEVELLRPFTPERIEDCLDHAQALQANSKASSERASIAWKAKRLGPKDV